MELQQVKNNLNKMVVYKGAKGIYKLTACILRKINGEFVHSVELLDTKHGNSLLFCKLNDIEVEE